MGATSAIPFIKFMDMAYVAHSVPLMARPMMMWVDKPSPSSRTVGEDVILVPLGGSRSGGGVGGVFCD